MSAKVEDLKDPRVPNALYWTYADVADWVESLGFPQYKECFLENGIDGKRLVCMDASFLPRIGVTDFEHIKTISQSVRELLGVDDPYWNRTITLPPRDDLGMYLERKSRTGETSRGLTFSRFLTQNADLKWRPPLSNHCLIMPNY